MNTSGTPQHTTRNILPSYQVRDQCSISIGRTNLSSTPFPLSPQSTMQSPDKREKCLHFQQSLLILIHLHLLRRRLKSSISVTQQSSLSIELYSIHDNFLRLKQEIPTFYKNVGYVSQRFFQSAHLATKMFFQTTTFKVASEDLNQLSALSSFFKADLHSVFLLILKESFTVEEFLKYSRVILGISFAVTNHNVLEFLNKSCVYFPCLKQVHVAFYGPGPAFSNPLLFVLESELFSLLIELLIIDTTVTSVNFSGSLLGDEGVRALADALKVNTTVTDYYLSRNSIGDEGARALADALKVNTSVTDVELSRNSIGVEGARALADALKFNTSVTNIDLSSNSIGDEGARALADALKVNIYVTDICLWENSVGDEGARALADALKVNTTVTDIKLWENSIGRDFEFWIADPIFPIYID
ncbi:hypothetical protein GEMRC1_013630 [Eukaryota sp. GEM-RC1]